MVGICLVGEAGGMKRAVKPVAAAVAGKHPAGAIAAMRRRRQTDDQNPRLRITKAGQRLGPISLAVIATRWLLCRRFAPTHQAWTTPACDDGFVQLFDRDHLLLFCYHTAQKTKRIGIGRLVFLPAMGAAEGWRTVAAGRAQARQVPQGLHGAEQRPVSFLARTKHATAAAVIFGDVQKYELAPGPMLSYKMPTIRTEKALPARA